MVLADRGFDVVDSVALYGATLDIPAFPVQEVAISLVLVRSTLKPLVNWPMLEFM